LIYWRISKVFFKLGFFYILSIGLLLAGSKNEPEFKFRLVHFLASTNVVHIKILESWAEKIQRESEGRIQITLYPAAEFGTPLPQLYNLVKDDIVDFVWTLPGFTPGQFPLTEVFELPFMESNADISTPALMTFYKQFLWKDYRDVHMMLLLHTPGTLHMANKRVRTLEDFKDLNIRVPSDLVASTLKSVGANPVIISSSHTYEALERKTVDGAFMPFEAVYAFHINKLLKYHTKTKLYSNIIMFLMNQNSYAKLPGDLQKVIDKNSGMELAKTVADIEDEDDKKGLLEAKTLGHETDVLSPEDELQWIKLTEPIVADWIRRVNLLGEDGKALYQAAKDIIYYYQVNKTPPQADKSQTK
jgi:TRAP-type C4-dicarboxylate transport system substrate-binding protein